MIYSGQSAKGTTIWTEANFQKALGGGAAELNGRGEITITRIAQQADGHPNGVAFRTKKSAEPSEDIPNGTSYIDLCPWLNSETLKNGSMTFLKMRLGFVFDKKCPLYYFSPCLHVYMFTMFQIKFQKIPQARARAPGPIGPQWSIN